MKIKTLLLSSTSLWLLPLATLSVSCSKATEIGSYVLQKNKEHFATKVEVSTIYENQNFTFSFTLNDSCSVNEASSYVRCGYNTTHALNGQYVTCQKEGNKYTYTVDKSIVVPNFVNIYISTYKYFSIDVSQTPTTDFEFVDVLTPTPIENETYYIGFKVLNNKGLDLSQSVITVGSTPLTVGQYIAYEAEYNSTTYTFIRISSKYVTSNIQLKLVAGEAVAVEAKTYPEYSLLYLSKPVKNNDFYCYFELANPYKYELDTDQAVIKVGGAALTKDKYTFYEQYLRIDGTTITGDVSIDLPVKEFYNVYSSSYLENPTVLAVGEKFYKGQEYTFYVYPLNDKEILWNDENSYLTINDTQIKSSGFNYEWDTEKVGWKITLTAAQTLGDIYCHFITQ